MAKHLQKLIWKEKIIITHPFGGGSTQGRVDGLRLEASDRVELLDRRGAEARERAEDRTPMSALSLFAVDKNPFEIKATCKEIQADVSDQIPVGKLSPRTA